MNEIITREELGHLLEQEGWLDAGERIFMGQDPVRVLTELRPFIPRYNDAGSRAAIEILRAICRGGIEVTD